MFTIKFVNGTKTHIKEAESFTVIQNSDNNSSWMEVTLHQHNVAIDTRVDVGSSPYLELIGQSNLWDTAYIENAMGKTVQIVTVPQYLKRTG